MIGSQRDIAKTLADFNLVVQYIQDCQFYFNHIIIIYMYLYTCYRDFSVVHVNWAVMLERADLANMKRSQCGKGEVLIM